MTLGHIAICGTFPNSLLLYRWYFLAQLILILDKQNQLSYTIVWKMGGFYTHGLFRSKI